MTKNQIHNQLIKKNKELTKWSYFINSKNKAWIYPVGIASGIIILIISIVLFILGLSIPNVAIFLFGMFLFFCGLTLLIADIVCWPIFKSKVKKAPYMYNVVSEEIEELKKQLENYDIGDKNVSNNSNIDDLIKYKKLLDEGIITQSEFDEIKKNLLKRI